MALSFARALGEFGSVVLISGNIPNHTEVASVRVSALIGTGDLAGAASVSVVLLAASLAMLVVFELLRRRGAEA
jgi:sulfate transport system permease protein